MSLSAAMTANATLAVTDSRPFSDENFTTLSEADVLLESADGDAGSPGTCPSMKSSPTSPFTSPV